MALRAGLAVLAVLAVAAIVHSLDDGSSGAADSSCDPSSFDLASADETDAAAALDRAARNAATAVDEGLPYSYQKRQSGAIFTTAHSGRGAYSFYNINTRESWVASDGSGRLRLTQREAWPSSEDRKDNARYGDPGIDPKTHLIFDREYEAPTPVPVDGGDQRLPDIGELVGAPETVGCVVREAALEGLTIKQPVAQFDLASEILLGQGLTPAVRAAAFEVLAEVPGVTIVKNPAGALRGAITVAVEAKRGHGDGESATRHELTFNERSSAVLGVRDELLEPADYIGSGVPSYTTLLARGEVKGVRERPGAVTEAARKTDRHGPG